MGNYILLANAILLLFKFQQNKTGKCVRKYSFSRVGFLYLTPFWQVLKWCRGPEQDKEAEREPGWWYKGGVVVVMCVRVSAGPPSLENFGGRGSWSVIHLQLLVGSTFDNGISFSEKYSPVCQQYSFFYRREVYPKQLVHRSWEFCLFSSHS